MAALGKVYRDRVSGYEGMAIGRAEYLYEEPSVQVARADSFGKPESLWLPEGRLEPVEDSPPPGFTAPGDC